MRQCDRESRAIDSGAELMQARGTVRGKAHVIFARPDHFHRSIDRLRHQRGFDGIVVLEAPAKSAAHQRDVDLYLIGIESDGGRDRVAAILRNLRWRPQFALRALKVRRAISRFHGRVRHERQFVFGGNVPPGNLRGISGCVQVRALLGRGLLQRSHDCGGIQILVRALVPGDVEHAAALHGSPNAVSDHGDGGVADLADVTHARDLLRFLVVERRDFPGDGRTTREHRELHSGHAEVDAEDGVALDLGGRVDARQALSDDLVVLALLERNVGWNRQRRCFAGQFSVTQDFGWSQRA